jgi:hypothetical protein
MDFDVSQEWSSDSPSHAYGSIVELLLYYILAFGACPLDVHFAVG